MRSMFPFVSPLWEQSLVVRALQSSGTEKQQQEKIRIYSLLRRLMKKRRSSFGMLVVYNWKRQWFKDYASFPDATQNLFSKKAYQMEKHSPEHTLELFMQLSRFDDAILISQQGTFIASGVYLENMQPKEAAQEIAPGKADDLSDAFGFVKKVHARHLVGIACSYRLRGTTVYTISEEQRILRIFENGKIIYSSLRHEVKSE